MQRALRQTASRGASGVPIGRADTPYRVHDGRLSFGVHEVASCTGGSKTLAVAGLTRCTLPQARPLIMQ